MNIRDLATKFPKCPKCGSDFIYETFLRSDKSGMIGGTAKLVVSDNDIRIIIHDPSKSKKIDFAIAYLDGKVLFNNGTKKAVFDKFDHFTIDVICRTCMIDGKRGFETSYHGDYDADTAAFENFDMDFYSFTYVVDDILYHITTDYLDNYASLDISNLNTGAGHYLRNLPIFDLDFFDFTNREQMKQKFQTMTLLA